MKQILSSIRKAVEDYNMIEEGDKIAVALSGGKDSVTLLLALKNLQIFYPKHFELMALTVDPGSETFDTTEMEKLCEKIGVEYVIERTNIKQVVFDIRKEKNPCSLCANLRRGILYDTAKKYGCNKVALGHHMDDVMETFMMSLIYEGRVHTFLPVTYLSRKDIYVIRPMIYTPESEIKHLVKKYGIEVVKNNCPANGETKRQYVKELITGIAKENKGVRESIFGAIMRSEEWRTLKEE